MGYSIIQSHVVLRFDCTSDLKCVCFMNHVSYWNKVQRQFILKFKYFIPRNFTWWYHSVIKGHWLQESEKNLEKLECLRSEDIPRPLMITHIIESYWIPSQRKTKSKLQIKEFAKISNFYILKQTLHLEHLLKLLDKMCKYEMDPTSIVEDTGRTRFCPQMDRRTDGQGETSILPLSTLLK